MPKSFIVLAPGDLDRSKLQDGITLTRSAFKRRFIEESVVFVDNVVYCLKRRLIENVADDVFSF